MSQMQYRDTKASQLRRRNSRKPDDVGDNSNGFNATGGDEFGATGGVPVSQNATHNARLPPLGSENEYPGMEQGPVEPH